MKRLILTTITLATIATAIVGQPVRQPLPIAAGEHKTVDLPTFDLDFNGGTPQQLVEAIRAYSDTPLNAIIPVEHKDVQLPPLKMKGVNVKQLFEALELANMKMIPYVTGAFQFGGDRGGRRTISERSSTMSFRTTPPVTRESIWYFQVTKPEPLPELKTVRYYQLKPYLSEYDINDITTAIQAGWKMLGETEAPKLNFHEDTSLLIAVGPESQLALIDSVLQQLFMGISAPEPQSSRRVRSGSSSKESETSPAK